MEPDHYVAHYCFITTRHIKMSASWGGADPLEGPRSSLSARCRELACLLPALGGTHPKSVACHMFSPSQPRRSEQTLVLILVPFVFGEEGGVGECFSRGKVSV